MSNNFFLWFTPPYISQTLINKSHRFTLLDETVQLKFSYSLNVMNGLRVETLWQDIISILEGDKVKHNKFSVITGLFIISKTESHPNGQQLVNGQSKMYSIHMVEYYSNKKRPQTDKCSNINLKNIQNWDRSMSRLYIVTWLI